MPSTRHIRTLFLLPLIAMLLACGRATAQDDLPRAEHGWHMAPYGQIHVLLIYAEMDFDSTYGHLDPVKDPEGTWKWKTHKMPAWKDKAISADPEGDGFLTTYFRQASFGKFKVTGDYLDTLITVKISDVLNPHGRIVEQEAFGNRYYKQAVLRQVNGMENPKFGFGSRPEEFDRWTFTGAGRPNKPEPNGKYDLVVLIWRNIHVANLGEASGFVSPGSMGKIYGRESDMYSIFRSSNFLPKVILRHEFSHMLYGGNNFHTANGGVGQRTFIPTVGGWSNMSASDACSRTWNAWDRERMNWPNPENRYLLSTRCAATGEEMNGAMQYGDPLCRGGEYILRDFASTGDAIKITLPHLPGKVRRQYLWLENHQRKDGFYDHDEKMPKGLYAYITVGKDEREGRHVFGGANNYIWPLPAHGQYDFELGEGPKTPLILRSDRANPLTGHNYLMRIVSDKNGDGKIRITTDVRPKTEYDLPAALVVDGETMPEEYFSYKTYPIFGTQDVAFRPDGRRKMGISHNPAATPVLSHIGTRPLPDDNRRVYLNGLSVEVLDEGADGALRLKVRWDDFDIVEHVRWCGNVLLSERAVITRGASVTLDQGWSVQEATAVQQIDGENVFAYPTVLEVDSGATLRIEGLGNLWIRGGSTLLIRKGAKVEIGRNGAIVAEPGAFVYVEEGAQLDLDRNRAKFRLRNGAQKGIHPLLAPAFGDLRPMAEVDFSR